MRDISRNKYFSEHDQHSHYHHRLVKHIFKLRYPKLTFYSLFVILAYYFFTSDFFSPYALSLVSHGYWSMLLAGLLFSYGFTTPFSIGIFLLAHPPNLILASLIAGSGAFLADTIIFTFIRFTMMDEFRRLQKSPPLKTVHSLFHHHFSARAQKCLLYVVAGLIIASPLPDELGVALLAGLSRAHPGIFALVSFFFNTAGIFVMLTFL